MALTTRSSFVTCCTGKFRFFALQYTAIQIAKVTIGFSARSSGQRRPKAAQSAAALAAIQEPPGHNSRTSSNRGRGGGHQNGPSSIAWCPLLGHGRAAMSTCLEAAQSVSRERHFRGKSIPAMRDPPQSNRSGNASERDVQFSELSDELQALKSEVSRLMNNHGDGMFDAAKAALTPSPTSSRLP